MSIGRFGPIGLRRTNNQAVANAEVGIFNTGTSVLATLYSDLAGTVPLANPMHTDSYGNLTFCAEAGNYDLLVNGGRIVVPVDPAPVASGGGGGGGSEEPPAPAVPTSYVPASAERTDRTFRWYCADMRPQLSLAASSIQWKPDAGILFDGGLDDAKVKPAMPGLYQLDIVVMYQAGWVADAYGQDVMLKLWGPLGAIELPFHFPSYGAGGYIDKTFPSITVPFGGGNDGIDINNAGPEWVGGVPSLGVKFTPVVLTVLPE